MQRKMKKVEELRDLIGEKIATEEHNLVTIKGFKFTRSDLEVLEIYLSEFIQTNGFSFGNLMNPVGNIKKILEKIGIFDEKQLLFSHGW